MSLPEGFVLEAQPQQPQGSTETPNLPQGFVLENPSPFQKMKGTEAQEPKLDITGNLLQGASKAVDTLSDTITPSIWLNTLNNAAVNALKKVGLYDQNRMPYDFNKSMSKPLLPNLFVDHPTPEELQNDPGYAWMKNPDGTLKPESEINALNERMKAFSRIPGSDADYNNQIIGGLSPSLAFGTLPRPVVNKPGVITELSLVAPEPEGDTPEWLKSIGGVLAPVNRLISDMSSIDSLLTLTALPKVKALQKALALVVGAKTPEKVVQNVEELKKSQKGAGDYVKAGMETAVDLAVPFALSQDYNAKEKPTGIKPSELRQGSPDMPFITKDAPKRVFNMPDVQGPFQETPPLIGQRPLSIEQPIITGNAPQTVMPIPQIMARKAEPLGGQVSFEGQGIPNARQQAVEAVRRDPTIVEEASEPIQGASGPYQRPTAAPTQEQFARKLARQSVEQGMYMPEVKQDFPLPYQREGQYPPEGVPTGTFSNLQKERIQAGKDVRSNERKSPPMDVPKGTKLSSGITFNKDDFKIIGSGPIAIKVGDTVYADTKGAHFQLADKYNIPYDKVVPGFLDRQGNFTTSPGSMSEVGRRFSSGLDPEEAKKLIVPAVRLAGRTITGKQGDTHADILERAGVPASAVPHPSPDRGFVLNGQWMDRTQAAQVMGVKGTADAGGLDSMDLVNAGKFRALREAGMGRQDVEDIVGDDVRYYSGIGLDKIEDTFTPTARLLLRDPKRLRYDPSKTGEYDAGQLVNRLMNQVPPAEAEILRGAGIHEAFPPGKKVKAGEVDKWVEENGPRVEVRKLEATSIATPGQVELASLQHEWFDNLKGEQRENVRGYINGSMSLSAASKYGPDFETKLKRYKALMDDPANHSISGHSESATALYTMVNPKPLDKMPGAVDLLVRVPLKEVKAPAERSRFVRPDGTETEASKYTSPHYPTEGKNLLAHVRGYMETLPDGKKVFHVFEVQSDWAQEVLKDRKELENMLKQRGDNSYAREGMKASNERFDPLLSHYERLALKAAIEHAKKEGADAIAVSDGPTAIMTEMQDQHPTVRAIESIEDVKRKIEAHEGYEAIDDGEGGLSFIVPGGKKIVSGIDKNGLVQGMFGYPEHGEGILKMAGVALERVAKQEPGMRLHYDRTLPKIAEELTGGEGKVVDFGEHQNAFDVGYGRLGVSNTPIRKNLIFRNPDGSPKTSITARMYDLSKTGDAPYSMMGRKLYSGLDVGESLARLFESIKTDRSTLAMALSKPAREIKDLISAKRDAVDNAPLLTQEKAESKLNLTGNRIFGKEQNDLAQAAANVYLEAHGDITKLPKFKAQAAKAKYSDGVKAVEYAEKNWSKLPYLTKISSAIDDMNLDMAKKAGIPIPRRDDYVKRAYEGDERGLLFRDRDSAGVGRSSLLFRKFPTVFDAIEAGHKPETLNLAALVGKRTREIQQDINLHLWTEGLKNTKFDGKPIIQDLGTPIRGVRLPPEGYVGVTVSPGHSVAVLKGFDRLMKAVSSESHVSGSLPGQALLQGIGAVKHGTLAFDTFHAFRIGQFYKSINFTGNFRHGLSLLEYSKADIDEAIKQGELPASARAYVDEKVNVPSGPLTRHEVNTLGIRNGLNIGKHSEAIYSSFIRSFPGFKQTLGEANRFIFDKLSRGAIADAFQFEFERVANEQPKWTNDQVARSVARDLNYRLGNIGRQGIFKSRTMQDLMQVVFLAPRWVESMAQSESRSMGQLAQSFNPMSDRFGKRPTLLRSTTNLLAAYVVGAQVINMLSTGHPTWDNDKDHKLDAYIPPASKGGKGFWLSPLSVVAELMHDVLRYNRQGKGAIGTMTTIAENKFSSVGRAVDTATTGGPMNRGELDPLGALGELLNPTPLPIRQGVKSAKQKDLVPFERQGLAMIGLKSEPESNQDVRERETKGLTLKQRISYEKEKKAGLPPQTESGKRQAAERSIEGTMKRGTETLSSLTKADRQWVESRGLTMPGYDNKIREGKTSVYLTKPEMERLASYTKEAVEEKLQIARRKPDVYSKQSNFSELMSAAHAKARHRLIQELKNPASVSENEKDNKKSRYSAFRP